MRESLSKSSSFALKAVYSGAIKAISSKALRAVTASVRALKAAAVTVCAGALEAAATAAVYAGGLKSRRCCRRSGPRNSLVFRALTTLKSAHGA